MPELPLWRIEPGIYVIDDTGVDFSTLAWTSFASSVNSSGDAQDSYTPEQSVYDYPSNALWIEVVGLTNSSSNLSLKVHGTQSGEVYELQNNTQLNLPGWEYEQTVHGWTNQD